MAKPFFSAFRFSEVVVVTVAVAKPSFLIAIAFASLTRTSAKPGAACCCALRQSDLCLGFFVCGFEVGLCLISIASLHEKRQFLRLQPLVHLTKPSSASALRSKWLQLLSLNFFHDSQCLMRSSSSATVLSTATRPRTNDSHFDLDRLFFLNAFKLVSRSRAIAKLRSFRRVRFHTNPFTVFLQPELDEFCFRSGFRFFIPCRACSARQILQRTRLVSASSRAFATAISRFCLFSASAS